MEHANPLVPNWDLRKQPFLIIVVYKKGKIKTQSIYTIEKQKFSFNSRNLFPFVSKKVRFCCFKRKCDSNFYYCIEKNRTRTGNLFILERRLSKHN